MEVLVDESTKDEASEPAPLTVAVLRQRQNELLEQLPPVTRQRLRFLAKHWDVPELAALRMAVADAYQNALDDDYGGGA
jgi:hypothetical protein